MFQAGVLNYVEYLRTWFGRTIGDRTTPPLLSLVWDLTDLDPKLIRKRHGASALKFLQERRTQVEYAERQAADRRLSIPLEYKLVLTKKPREADITLGSGPDGAIAGQIVHVPKDVSVTHPHTHKLAVKEVQRKLGGTVTFSTHDFQAILHKEEVKKPDSSPLHYLMKQTGTHCYSDSLIESIVTEVKGDAEYLEQARAGYRTFLNRKAARA